LPSKEKINTLIELNKSKHRIETQNSKVPYSTALLYSPYPGCHVRLITISQVLV